MRHDPDRLEAEHAQWLEDRGIEEHERSGGAWSSIFRQQAAEMPECFHDERPAIDRRLFAVDGELMEQARRDAEHHDLPGSAA